MAKNYKRFYALLKQNPDADKDDLVMSFTGERTSSLREMTDEEFNSMCEALQYGAGQGYGQRTMNDLKASRSAVLVRMGRLGIETVDNWDGIDQFCLSKRIAGKRFAQLSVPELNALRVKLDMILRRGGVKVAGGRREKGSSPRYETIIRIPKPKSRYMN